MKMVSVTFQHYSPMSRFDAMIHIQVTVSPGAGVSEAFEGATAQHEAIVKATRLLSDNVSNPEQWEFRGITAPYEVDDEH